MSYAYELADEAMAGFRELETWVAEEFLDEMERLVANPPAGGRRTSGGTVGEVVRDRGDDRFYVFFTTVWDRQRQVLRVSSLGHYIRRGNPPDAAL